MFIKIILGSCSAAGKGRRSDKRSTVPCHSLKTEHGRTRLVLCPSAWPGRGLAQCISLCQRCLVHHSPPWLVLLNFPDHQRRAAKPLRRSPAPSRFPFSSAKKLICINFQAVGNPSLMIHHHRMHPFSAGEEKGSASSVLLWKL